MCTLEPILGDPGADSGDEGKSKRAEKYGTKKSKERREDPLGTMSYQTSSKRSPPFWLLIGARKPLVRHCPKGSSRRSLLFFVPYFPARLDFPSPPLSAPGSPRMTGTLLQTMSCVATEMERTLVLLSNVLIMVKITRNIDLPCVAVIILYWSPSGRRQLGVLTAK